MPELELPVARESALICWPVLWDSVNEGPAPKVEGIHVTAVYWPAYGEDDQPPNKDILLRTLGAYATIYRGYTLVKVEGPAAFGIDNNFPVVKVESGYYSFGLKKEYRTITNCLTTAGFSNYDKRFEFNPHCSVDIQTLLDPPKRLILGPPELWYKNDEPVKI